MFKKIFGDPNQKKLKQIQPLVEKINELESEFEAFSDEDISRKTEEFKERFKKGETLDDILVEAFALVREAAKRVLDQRHFDVQLLGGVILHQGQIAEMKTGEGKTLSSTLPIYLNALSGKGVHVVTVNDYLTKRDTNWMGPLYQKLGLSCGCLTHDNAFVFEPTTEPDSNEVTVEMENLKNVSRKEAYSADITYGTNNEFGFDYLRDNMAPSKEAMVQRDPNFAIIDEVDSALIDEARTPLIISAPDTESTKMYEQFSKIVPQLKKDEDYNIDEKMRAATLTEKGIDKVEKILGMDNIYQEGGIRYVHHLEQALKAEVLFKKDKDYVVKEGEIVIIDEFTGRLMPGRRYSEGLHQALEAKEGVKVQQESRTLASITFQNYFRMYPKLSGMTGTAWTSREEFQTVYNLEVTIIPTHKPMIRKDLNDSVYRSEKGKFQAIVREIQKRHETGQPILVGTVSIEKNEILSEYLKRAGIEHKLLNAKNHEQEAQIISQAGRKGAVTVATNMAGRGVDIILGGRPEDDDSENKEQWKKDHQEIIDLGGLHVLGTERHEARRIDDQLRGRAGRQGDPGSSQFFVSLEDDLMRVFGGERVQNMMNTLKVPEDQPIESRFVSHAIESAQSKIEGHHFDMRKHILEYDEVLSRQRETIYRKRKEALLSENLKPQILETIDDEIISVVDFHLQQRESHPKNENNQETDAYKEIKEAVSNIFAVSADLEKNISGMDAEKIKEYLIDLAHKAYEKKEEEMSENMMRQVERFVLLRSIDTLWMDHLDNMDHLRDSVKLRAYGQKDPLVEYKNEGAQLFQKLLSSIENTVATTIYKVSLEPEQKTAPASSQANPQDLQENRRQANLNSSKTSSVNPANSNKTPGRNDPCPCGSGKKYKKCCGN